MCSSADAVKIEKGNAISRGKPAEQIYFPSLQITILVKWSGQAGVLVLLWPAVFGCQ